MKSILKVMVKISLLRLRFLFVFIFTYVVGMISVVWSFPRLVFIRLLGAVRGVKFTQSFVLFSLTRQQSRV